MNDYRRLGKLYAGAGSPPNMGEATLIKTLNAAEERTTLLAMSSGLPVCAPHAPGLGVIQPH